MKRWHILTVLMCMFICIQTSACTKSSTGTGDGTPEVPEIPSGSVKYEKALVLYFSRTGNTAEMASIVHSETGGTLTEIKTVTPYPEAYDEVLEQGREEINSGFRPPLSTRIDDMNTFDIIFIGYPIWFGTIPPPIDSFLTQYDFAGKTIVPFCTSGSSGGSTSYGKIRSLCPQSTVLDGLQITGASASSSQNTVKEWLTRIGVK